MSALLVLSTTLITLALIFYSIGVWSEKLASYLKPWHVVTFWIGFLFDTGGTYTMHIIANRPFDFLNPHSLTGQIAIWLMLAHAIWATIVTLKGNEKIRKSFHRYSLIVWIIWLVPYFGGMYIGMSR